MHLVFAGLDRNQWKGELEHIFTGYTGLLLLGGVAIAMGTFGSSLTRHQLVAAMFAAVDADHLFDGLVYRRRNRRSRREWSLILRCMKNILSTSSKVCLTGEVCASLCLSKLHFCLLRFRS